MKPENITLMKAPLRTHIVQCHLNEVPTRASSSQQEVDEGLLGDGEGETEKHRFLLEVIKNVLEWW